MNKCPKCEEKIKELYYCHAKYENGTYDGKVLKADMPFEFDQDSIEFRCPNCEKLLFITQEDAYEFFNKSK